MVRPIDIYRPSVQQLIKLVELQQKGINSCLRAQGSKQEWKIVDDSALLKKTIEVISKSEVTRSDLWGFFDVTNVEAFGYSGSPSEAGAASSGPLPEGVTQQQLAGCIKESSKDLPGQDLAIFLAGNGVLPGNGPPVAEKDSRYAAVVSSWKECMKIKGFDVEDPLTALRSSLEGNSTDRNQITKAVADIKCKIDTNLVGIGVAVQSAYDKEYIRAYESELNSYREQIDNYIRDDR